MTTIFVKDGLVFSDTRITTTTYRNDEVINVAYKDESKVEAVNFDITIDGTVHHIVNSVGAGNCRDINRRILNLIWGMRGYALEFEDEPNYSIFFISDAGIVFKDTPNKPMFKVGRFAKAGSGATNPGICCIAVFSPKLAVQAASIIDRHTGGRVEQTQTTTTTDVGSCGTITARYALLTSWLALGAILLTTLPIWLPLGFAIRGFNLLRKGI